MILNDLKSNQFCPVGCLGNISDIVFLVCPTMLHRVLACHEIRLRCGQELGAACMHKSDSISQAEARDFLMRTKNVFFIGLSYYFYYCVVEN